MPAKRIIPCLDVKNGRVVKGIHFENLRDAGDPVEAAARYDAQGADEVTYLDIAATQENRGTLARPRRAAPRPRVFAPLTVGGGVRSEAEMVALLRAGADKVSVNSAAVKDPALVDRLSAVAGAQALVVAIDVKRRPGTRPQEWEVYIAGGTQPTGVEGHRLGRGGGPARRRGAPAHQHGPGRHARRLRPRAARAGLRGGLDPGHRLGRRGDARAPRRGAPHRGRRARGQHLPRRPAHGAERRRRSCGSAVSR